MIKIYERAGDQLVELRLVKFSAIWEKLTKAKNQILT